MIFQRIKKLFISNGYCFLADRGFDELLKKSIASFAVRLVGLMGGYIFILFSARLFGPSAMGLLAMFQLFLMIMTLLAKCGLDVAVVRLINEERFKDSWAKKNLIRMCRRIILAVSLLIAGFFLLTSSCVAEMWFGKPVLILPLRVASCLLPLYALLHLHAGVLRGIKHTSLYMFFVGGGVPTMALPFLIIFPFIFREKLGDFVPIFSYLGGVVILSAVSLIFVGRYFQWHQQTGLEAHKVISTKNLLHCSLPMMVAGSAAFLMGWTDTLMLGMLKTTEAVGVYNVSFRLAFLVSLPLIAVNSIAAPRFAQMHGAASSAGIAHYARQASAIVFWSSLPIGVIFLFSSNVLLNLFGTSFAVGSMAFMFLIAGHLANALTGPVGQLLNMTGRQVVLQNTGLCALFVNVLLNALLIPKMGICGAAVATAISGSLWNVLCIFYLLKVAKLRTFYFPFFAGVS